ncbi:immunity 53 family protein [Hymenobacter sp. BT664]|uniref:Immunity 53 family protein n=1 Tax=Hymenobacter montanus TaxID=2771359 RepID=A0A927BG19_9BACT|nr:immunity 53 family protein [Hymenobacter montanus]MBD2769590.1 immunity 53 family protein [Hymenobacter montanus]
MLTWLQQWFLSQCDEEWEHEYGIKICTLDNPGWSIKIDLAYTELEDVRISIPTIEESAGDWYSIVIVDGVFSSLCSPNKLDFVISDFKALVELGEARYLADRPQARMIPFAEGYSISKGLPKPVREYLYKIIDEEQISSANMHEKGASLANAIRPILEKLINNSDLDMQSLIMLVYRYGWNYIHAKHAS